jgi:type IV pilus assembly protein PilO
MAFNIKEKREYMILAVVGGALILYVYFMFLLKPQFTSLISVFREAGQIKRSLVQTMDNVNNMPLMEKKIEKAKEVQPFYEKKLPREEELPTLLGNLSELARENNVKIISIKPIKDEDEPEGGESVYMEIPIQVKARCGYHQLGRFINDLESADRFMMIGDINIKSIAKSKTIHDVKLVVYTYILSGS